VTEAPPDIPIPEAVPPQKGWSYGDATAVCVLMVGGEGTAKGRVWGVSLVAGCAAAGGVVVWAWRWRSLAVCAVVTAVIALVVAAAMVSGGSIR
jgi:hypothetical protein